MPACRASVALLHHRFPTSDFQMPGTMPPGITFTRASTGTYFDTRSTLQTATANTAALGLRPGDAPTSRDC